MLLTGTLKTACAQKCVTKHDLNTLGQNMDYVVQACEVLKNLVYAEANARAQKAGFFVAFLTQTRFLCVITN